MTNKLIYEIDKHKFIFNISKRKALIEVASRIVGSVSQLAERLGVSRETVYQWIKGQRIRKSNEKKLTEIINCDLDLL